MRGGPEGRSRGDVPLREGRPDGGADLPRRGGVHAHPRGGADVDAHRLGAGVASALRPGDVLGPPRRVCAHLRGEHLRPGHLRAGGGADAHRLRFPKNRCPFPAYGVCPHVHPVTGLRSDASRRRHVDRRPGPRPGDGHPRHSVVVRYSRGPRLPLTAGRPDDSLVETGDCPPWGIGDPRPVHGARHGPISRPMAVATVVTRRPRLNDKTLISEPRFSTGREDVGRFFLLIVGLRGLGPGRDRSIRRRLRCSRAVAWGSYRLRTQIMGHGRSRERWSTTHARAYRVQWTGSSPPFGNPTFQQFSCGKTNRYGSCDPHHAMAAVASDQFGGLCDVLRAFACADRGQRLRKARPRPLFPARRCGVRRYRVPSSRTDGARVIAEQSSRVHVPRQPTAGAAVPHVSVSR